MKILATRARLLGSAALGLGLAMAAAQPAQAACTITTTVIFGDTISCATNTTTTDTVYPANPPVDRAYVSSGGAAVFLDVDPGVTVDGFGLYISGAADPLTVINDGIVRVNLGNTPTAGGSDAALAGIGGRVTYSGAGSVSNLGTGAGLQLTANGGAGLGGVSATIGGNILSTTGIGIAVNSTNAAGTQAISITTTGTVSAAQPASRPYTSERAGFPSRPELAR